MDIKRLVNNRHHQHVQSDCWQHQLPPVSSILHDHHVYPNGHHYPMPPQGEGNVYYHQQQQQQVYPQQQQYFAPPPQTYQQGPPPSYHQSPTSDLLLPYPFSTANPAARTSSSALSSSSSSSSTRYAPSSITPGPATSAERRSLSDGEDDGESSSHSEENHHHHHSSGTNTPLPPYYQHQQPHQQVSFADGTVTPSSDRSTSSEPATSEFVCDVCSVSYSRAPDLRRHKASVHNDRDSKEKISATFPCDVCGQVLLSSHGYQGHMRRHYDERPFVCEAPFCGKAFHDSATLARHRRTHSTEHKFECDFCGRRFKRKDNLNTHRKKHQTGGETINPNLLRKPVSRVNTSTGAVTPPVDVTTSPSTAFAEVPPPAFQTQLSQPVVPMDVSSAVPPAYSAAMQQQMSAPPPRQPLYAPQQPPMYHPYPQQQQQHSPISLHPSSYPSYYPNVKAEEYHQHRAMYAVAAPRN